jgi:predicted chitinase
MTITAAQIKKLAPRARPDLVDAIVHGWPEAEHGARLTTPLRVMHFLSQIMTETGGLTVLSESGAYSYSAIMKIFGVGKHSAKVTAAEAKKIAALPVAQRGPVLFDRVYGPGNPKKAAEFDNVNPGDGWRYRGGGMLQATGKNNYRRLAERTGMPLVENPELLHQPDSAFRSAWLVWGQDDRANKAADADDEVACRKVINGGTNGIAEYRTYLKKARTIFADFKPTAEKGPEPEPEAKVAIPEQTDGVTYIRGKRYLEIEAVQRALRDMGYVKVGEIDGKWGGNTKGAISAFKSDRGLEGPAVINDELKAELQKATEDKWKQPISKERKDATTEELAPKLPEVDASKKAERAGFWASITGFIGTAASAIVSSLGEAVEWLKPIKTLVGDVPWPVWIGGALIGVALFYYVSRKAGEAKDASVTAYQEGART